MACTFLLDIIWWSGPHFGIESDGRLGRLFRNLPLRPFERWLADGIYFACDNVIVPHRRENFGHLTCRQIIENNLFAFDRSRIEHANSYIERHDMFSGRKYRGDLCLLGVFISITINMTALYIRMGFGRREGHGPWNHGI